MIRTSFDDQPRGKRMRQGGPRLECFFVRCCEWKDLKRRGHRLVRIASRCRGLEESLGGDGITDEKRKCPMFRGILR